MRRRNQVRLPEAQINLTSLLDITFVLLISFMVVAPALRYNVDLQLPKVSDSRDIEKKKPVSIGVTYDKATNDVAYFVNGNPTTLSSIGDVVKRQDGWSADEVVALEADRSVPWEKVAQLINELKISEIHRIGIVTERGS